MNILNLIRRSFAPTTTYFDPAFGAAALGARTSEVPAAVDDMSAEEERLIHALFTEGILEPFDGFVVGERGAGANMSVDVGSGSAKADLAILAGSVAGQGNYLVRLDDAVDNLTIEPADATLDRIDEIYVVIQDDAYDSNGSFTLPRLAVRKGDAAASPTAPGADGSWTAALLLGTVQVGAAVTTIIDADITDERFSAIPAVPMVPVGSLLMYGAATAPSGFLLCQGQAVSRTTYARLFSIIGTTFGVGDGSTTFAVPDLRQKFPLGKAASGTGSTLGGTGGSIDHDHPNPETESSPSHTHGEGSYATDTEPDHSHTNPTTGTAGSHSHDVTGNTGPEIAGDGAGPSPGIVGSGHYHEDGTLATDTEAAHSHSQGSTGNGGGHSHTVTGTSGSSGVHTHTLGSTGTENPPFLSLNFIIRT